MVLNIYGSIAVNRFALKGGFSVAVIFAITIIMKLFLQRAPIKSRIKRQRLNLLLAIFMSFLMVLYTFPYVLEMVFWLQSIAGETGKLLPRGFDELPLILVFSQFLFILIIVLWDFKTETEWLGGRLALINDGSLGQKHSILVDRSTYQTLIVDVDKAQMLGDKIYITAANHYFIVDLKTMKIFAYMHGREIPTEYKAGFSNICWPLI